MKELLKLYFGEEEKEEEEEESSEEESSSEEDYMSIQALRSIQDKSFELLEALAAGKELPEWAEYKLAKVAGSLEEVHSYITYGRSIEASVDPQDKEVIGDLFGELRNIFKQQGSLEGSNKIVFLNKTNDLFEMEVYPVSSGYSAKAHINNMLLFEENFNAKDLKQVLKDLKKSVQKYK